MLASPAILYVAVIVWEMLTRPPQANPLDLAITGFTLISAIVIIPWLILCALCCAVGLRLRRLVRGDRRAETQRVSAGSNTQPALPGRSVAPNAPRGTAEPQGSPPA